MRASPVTPSALSNKTNVISSLTDAGMRGVFRFLEPDDKLRPLYRLGTEFIRKGAEGSVINVLEGERITKEVWSTGLKRALENAAATVVLEPNLSDSRFKRVLLGLGNMLIRFGVRVGLFGLNIISSDELGINDLHEQLFARGFGRVVYTASDDPVMGIGVRAFEQALINLSLHVVKPVSRFTSWVQSLWTSKQAFNLIAKKESRKEEVELLSCEVKSNKKEVVELAVA